MCWGRTGRLWEVFLPWVCGLDPCGNAVSCVPCKCLCCTGKPRVMPWAVLAAPHSCKYGKTSDLVKCVLWDCMYRATTEGKLGSGSGAVEV